jgi:hypothetical protein
MKKLAVMGSLILAMTIGSTVQAAVADTVLLYLPNRLIDLADIFTLELGFGPAIRGQARLTRACQLGAGVGATVKAVKGINRQYGGAMEEGWDANFLMIATENKEREKTSRGVTKFYYYATGTPLPTEKLYDFYEGARDYWAFGAEAAALVEIVFEAHPIEIADFATGWIFIDLKGDDLTGDDLRL